MSDIKGCQQAAENLHERFEVPVYPSGGGRPGSTD